MASTSGDVVHIAVINTVVSASANQNQNHLLQMSKETSLESIVAELCTQVCIFRILCKFVRVL